MTASIFGPSPLPGFANAQNYTVLSDGRIAVLYHYSGNNSSATDAVLVQFVAPDGTALGSPVNLDPTGSGNFNSSGITPQLVALPDGGFAVLAENYDPTNGTGIFLASFDSQGNPVTGWTQVDSNVDGGFEHQLLALSNNGAYVTWATDANAGNAVTFPDGEKSNDSTDLLGATYTANGALAEQQTYVDAQLGTLVGQQSAPNPIQLSNGSVVVAYSDTAYYPISGNYNLGGVDKALSVVIGSAAPITVFAPSTGGSATQLDGDDHTAVALANGSFAIIYTLVTRDSSATTYDTYAKFYNADGSLAPQNTTGNGVLLFERTNLDGSGSYPDSQVSAVALPSGGFAVGYITHASGNTQSQVGLYDSGGNLVQTIPLTSTNVPQAFPGLSVAPDGSLYATTDFPANSFHIVGTSPGDFVLDGSADTAPETLTGTSTTNNWIYAGAGNTTIVGGPGTFDHIYAGTGTDIITGGATENFIEAGAGRGAIDGGGGATTVFFDGNQADYTLIGVAASFTVTNNATGAVDTLTRVQTLQFADGTVSTDTIACYARGTLIATTRGDIAIEHLAIGDRVLTASGAAKPVTWIGHRHLDCRRHPRPGDVWPVRIKTDAFGDKLPHSDLWLSPDHAVFVDDVLIPIRHLINDTTVTQEPRDEVDYWHVELAQHDVLLAEGLPAESYLDTGNRHAFGNGAVEALHPNLWQDG